MRINFEHQNSPEEVIDFSFVALQHNVVIHAIQTESQGASETRYLVQVPKYDYELHCILDVSERDL